jgi:hypothetical protein
MQSQAFIQSYCSLCAPVWNVWLLCRKRADHVTQGAEAFVDGLRLLQAFACAARLLHTAVQQHWWNTRHQHTMSQTAAACTAAATMFNILADQQLNNFTVDSSLQQSTAQCIRWKDLQEKLWKREREAAVQHTGFHQLPPNSPLAACQVHKANLAPRDCLALQVDALDHAADDEVAAAAFVVHVGASYVALGQALQVQALTDQQAMQNSMLRPVLQHHCAYKGADFALGK